MANRFQQGFMGSGGGVYKCTSCGKKTRETGEGESSLGVCRACHEYMGWENFCSDNCDQDGTHDPRCRIGNGTISVPPNYGG